MTAASRVNVAELVRDLRRGIAIPLGMAILFVAISCLYLTYATPLYLAKVTITSRPIEQDSIERPQTLNISALGALTGAKKLSSYEKLVAVLISNTRSLTFRWHGGSGYPRQELLRRMS